MTELLPGGVPRLTRLCDYVGHYAVAAPDREAIVFGERRLSYAALDREVDRCAAALQAAGVAAGDRLNHDAVIWDGGFAGQFVGAGLIIESAVDTAKVATERQALQRLIDCRATGKIGEIRGCPNGRGILGNALKDLSPEIGILRDDGHVRNM